MYFLIVIFIFLICYIFGSFPTGYLIGLYLKKIDIRNCGSGSTGATNVLRTFGKKAAITVLLLDISKAMLGVLTTKLIISSISSNILNPEWSSWLMVLGGSAVILGHSKSIFLNFTGGKSVASSLGVLLVLNPIIALGTLAGFLITLFIFRIVSISSIVGVLIANLLTILLNQPLSYCLFIISIGIYVIYRHQDNIVRILKGTEPKIGSKSQNKDQL
ncbi:MAG: glycerol-3-phosphate 1-O-acyltransferase PlsY [Candidatus Atelocyanobacterium thalassa]|uniref:Glycerol-3-phosphate acyltransferase n=1 Tax=Candidatus Atelocyanobacterium thalassa isolate SIO64986 TaxID=1527444 RepID=A0A086CIG0_9CHRO|nr:MAG: acyl-phosphate glycerol-3-phosphate acyltransferase [Candidatus Atelocyanobacterium thalassa isolate SIO64986]